MRHWLLTSTFYGAWLPGDERGFVGSVRDRRAGEPECVVRLEHDLPGDAYDASIPGLKRASAELMTGPPIFLELVHAQVLLAQFLETAEYRQWTVEAVAILYNHCHLVVTVPGDPDPTTVLGDFKAYGSRALNRLFGKPRSDTWWTCGGSKRKLPDDRAVRSGIAYVLYRQYNPLLTWQQGDPPDGVPGPRPPAT